MKDSEGELNRLLDQIRIEIEENGGQLEVKDLNNVIKKSEEIRKIGI